jgi:hypothetical protein
LVDLGLGIKLGAGFFAGFAGFFLAMLKYLSFACPGGRVVNHSADYHEGI